MIHLICNEIVYFYFFELDLIRMLVSHALATHTHTQTNIGRDKSLKIDELFHLIH